MAVVGEPTVLEATRQLLGLNNSGWAGLWGCGLPVLLWSPWITFPTQRVGSKGLVSGLHPGWTSLPFPDSVRYQPHAHRLEDVALPCWSDGGRTANCLHCALRVVGEPHRLRVHNPAFGTTHRGPDPEAPPPPRKPTPMDMGEGQFFVQVDVWQCSLGAFTGSSGFSGFLFG